jgi:hypothetical protein
MGYRIVPLAIVAIVFAVLFEVYKSDFERWVKPLTDWLRERESWSWILPTAILFILSFPPLFGHEIVQLVVGVSLDICGQVVPFTDRLVVDIPPWSWYWNCVFGCYFGRSGLLVSSDPI